MMTLANYGIGSSKQKDPNSAKVLSKSLQIRNRAELLLKQYLKSYYKVNHDKRSEILVTINDYYNRIAFNSVIWNKYQTKQCIIDSILLLDSRFNPYKAREAFKLVEQMLINLVHLPWHKEFREIHTYSGLYRLAICDPLIGVEEIFKAAGFQESPDNPLHLILPDHRMPQVDDGESVTSVIFDCLVAQVVFSNIIDIFEHCCKVSKRSEEHLDAVNSYSWIQAYFRERSHQTTERACASIQELLNNITNHLSKLESIGSKATNSDRNSNLTCERIEELNLKPSSSINNNNDSPKLTAQERTREFLEQQSREENNLVTLTNDLLRLPVNVDNARRSVQPTKYPEQEGSFSRSGSRTLHLDTQQPLLNNGYKSNQYHQQALYDRNTSPRSGVEPIKRDLVDYHNDVAALYRSSNDSLSHPVEVDIPHNDREPLIPRYERRVNSHYNTQPQPRKISIYDNDFESNNFTKSNGVGHLNFSRYHPDESYFGEYPSLQQAPTNHQMRSLASSKYSNTPHSKYEFRDVENKLTSNRSYWSCGSCTYNNQIISEICEMCRNKRPSR